MMHGRKQNPSDLTVLKLHLAETTQYPFIGIFLSTATGRRESRAMSDYRVTAGQATEDQFTASIEQYTSQLPSSAYLGLAIASILGSVSFQLAGKKHEALFVGQWVAPFLLLGIYNKMVKQHGSDAQTRS
jgi:hypothetical protein